MPNEAQGDILIVESSSFFAVTLERCIRNVIGANVVTAETMEKASRFIDEDPGRFSLALLDIELPDDPNGEIVDVVTAKGIPVIAMAEVYDASLRGQLTAERVIDVIAKSSPSGLELIVSTVERLLRNSNTTVLVVDDIDTDRRSIRNLLERHQFNVHEATNGSDALETIKSHPSITLVITVGDMAETDGFELTTQLRKIYGTHGLAIVGMSPSNGDSQSAKFISHGANDFLTKPFSPEELLCRVANCVDAHEQLAATDPATGLANRPLFFELGTVLLSASRRSSLQPTFAVLEIDDFKGLEEEYGVQIGEQILADVGHRFGAALLRSTDVTARIERDKFAVFTYDMKIETVADFFESIREVIASVYVDTVMGPVLATVSIGVCTTKGISFETMLESANATLKEAKTKGVNRVLVEQAA